MRKVASNPPSLWKIPDVVGMLLLPIAVLLVLIDAIVFRQDLCGQQTASPRIRQSSQS